MLESLLNAILPSVAGCFTEEEQQKYLAQIRRLGELTGEEAFALTTVPGEDRRRKARALLFELGCVLDELGEAVERIESPLIPKEAIQKAADAVNNVAFLLVSAHFLEQSTPAQGAPAPTPSRSAGAPALSAVTDDGAQE